MFRYILLTYIFLEGYSLYKFTELYGFADLFLLTISSGVLGLVVMSLQGQATLLNLQKSMVLQKSPTTDILHRIMMMLGGLLLFLPGVVNDLIGIILILPGLRHLLVFVGKAGFFSYCFSNIKIWGFDKRGGSQVNHNHADGPDKAAEDIVDVTPTEVVHKNSN